MQKCMPWQAEMYGENRLRVVPGQDKVWVLQKGLYSRRMYSVIFLGCT